MNGTIPRAGEAKSIPTVLVNRSGSAFQDRGRAECRPELTKVFSDVAILLAKLDWQKTSELRVHFTQEWLIEPRIIQ